MLRSLAVLLVLSAACGPMEEDELSATAPQAVTANSTVGVQFTATSSVKLRRGPGSGYAELASEWESEREERRSVHRRRSPHAAFGE